MPGDIGTIEKGSLHMADRLAASTNTYHSYSLEEALDGIARAGFRSVELTSVPGWTEHLSRDADEGVTEFRKALDLARKLGITKITTSTGGHADTSSGSLEDQRAAFLERIGPLADEAARD